MYTSSPSADPREAACMSAETHTALPAEAARTHFDRFAGVYGRSRLLPSLQQKALAELDLRPEDRLLDVACGAGALVGEVAPLVGRVVGTDLSEGMLSLARERVLERPDAPVNVEFRQALSDDLPFADDDFTAVVCTTALHHFPDAERSIAEMARVLAPGGRVVIGDMCRDRVTTKIADPIWRRFEAGHVGMKTKREIRGMLQRSGLRVSASRRVWLGLYGLVVADRPA